MQAGIPFVSVLVHYTRYGCWHTTMHILYKPSKTNRHDQNLFTDPSTTKYTLLLIDENSSHTLLISYYPIGTIHCQSRSNGVGSLARSQRTRGKVTRARSKDEGERKERLRLTIPEPMHILVTKIFFFSLFASDMAVATCLAPVHPSG
jgi:hypothetical protein